MITLQSLCEVKSLEQRIEIQANLLKSKYTHNLLRIGFKPTYITDDINNIHHLGLNQRHQPEDQLPYIAITETYNSHQTS